MRSLGTESERARERERERERERDVSLHIYTEGRKQEELAIHHTYRSLTYSQYREYWGCAQFRKGGRVGRRVILCRATQSNFHAYSVKLLS